jgi:hypothetical protein
MTGTPLVFTNANPGYLAASNRLQKNPVYFCKFGLVTGPLFNNPNTQVLPDQYCTFPVISPTTARKRFMKNPTQASNQIDPVKCRSTLASLEFTINDVGGDITRVVTNYLMKNRQVTVYAGYANIPESQYVPIYGGQIDDWKYTNDLTGITFVVAGGLKQLLTNILSGHTTLVSNFNGATKNSNGTSRKPDTVAYVTQLGQFAQSTNLLDGQGARNYIAIDNSIYSYAGLGTDIADGTVIWHWAGYSNSTGASPLPVVIYPWQPSTVYAFGFTITVAKNLYTCVQGGTSAGSGTGPSGQGQPMFYGLTLVNPGGNGDTVGTNHSSGASVDNFILYQGNPLTLMLQIMLSTGKGTNWSGTGTNYDVLPPGQGVGIPYSLVNISNIESQRDQLIADMIFSGYLKDAIQGIKFFENEFLQQVCGWLFENNTGHADVAMFNVAYGTQQAIILDDSLIIGNPQFDANLATGQMFYNEIYFQYDPVPVGSNSQNSFNSMLPVLQTDSQQAFQEASSLEVDCNMVTSWFNGYQISLRAATIFNSLFSTPPPKITVKLLYGAHLLQPGQVCYLSSKFLPNYKTGLKDNQPQLCVCINAQPDYNAGYVQAVLLGTGMVENRRFAGFANANVPSFSLATAAQKLYNAFFVDDTQAVPVMDDGSKPYVFTP